MNPTPSQTPQKIHLLGICGTAMAALAGALKEKGCRVTGTDEHVYPPISTQLEQLEIRFNEGYRAENIPPDTELVVVGNVIRRANPEAVEMERRGLPYLSMAEAVHRFAIAGRQTLAVVGTHGKTTTTTLAAHVWHQLGLDPGFLIGGIPRNFPANFRLGGGGHFVIEGDEYDTAYFDKTPKFFKYKPHRLIFTSLEFDHADIYDSLEQISAHFGQLLSQLPPDGLVAACADEPNVMALLGRAACPVVTYGQNPQADCRVESIVVEPEATRFTTVWQGERLDWSVPMAGDYNALNAASVAVMALSLGHGPRAIQKAFDSFLGVKRRQEERGVADGVRVVDDFAHHPTAVRLTLQGVRAKYPTGTLWAVFEPRSFTARSARFQAEWEEAFGGAGRVELAPAYVAPGSNGEGLLDTARLAQAINRRGGAAHACASNDELLGRLVAQTRPGDTVLVMSNGGFDNLHQRLLEALAARQTGG